MATGRKPQLTVVKNNATDRHTKAELEARREGEVRGAEARLKPPRTLSPEAKKEWRRIVKLYRQLDAEVINDLDIHLLAAYCENVAIFQKAEVEYQQQAIAEHTDKGWTESPYIRIMDGAAKNIMKAAEQLCLSPVGRARMGVLAAKKQRETDPMEQWLARRQNG